MLAFRSLASSQISSRWCFTPWIPALVLLFAAQPAAALIYTYENVSGSTIPEVTTSNAACNTNAALEVSFSVTDSFTVATIAVGVNLTHSDRGQIRAILNAPGGSSAVFLTQTTNSGDDPDNNYDILLSTNSEGVLDDGDADPTAEPFFNRLVTLAGANFYSGNSNGTWTLRICDRFSAGAVGTLNRAKLVLTSAQGTTTTATSTITYDWGSNGNNTDFTNVTINGVTITETSATSYNGSGGVNGAVTYGQNFRTNTAANLGNHSGFYNLYMVANAPPDSEEKGEQVVFTFSSPARDLQFTYLDVDFLTGDFEDQYRVTGTDDTGARVPYTLTIGGAHQIAGDIVEADAQATDTTGTNGNATVRFEGAVSTLTIDYSQGDDPAAANTISDQWTGFSDFTFVAYDYGDAPNTYGTQLAGGARHVLGGRDLYLGTNPPDGESDGQPAAAATTDDTTQVGGVDDEDGVASFPAYTAGSSTYTVSVTANNRSTTTAASLVGYIDWNRDGDFADANEISATTNVPANTVNGAVNVTWNSLPANAGGTTATYARFRISFTAAEVTSPTGLATSGEVEDYPIAAGTLPVTLASFHAERGSRGLSVVWSTETETATVGYRVLASGAAGWQPLSDTLVPAVATDSLEPQSYSQQLPDGKWRYLALEDWSTEGKATLHGPFEVGVFYGAEHEAEPIDWAAVAAHLAAYESDQAALLAKNLSNGFPTVTLGVEETGLYRLTHEQLLAAGFNFTGAPVSRLGVVKARDGKEVPSYVRGSTAQPAWFGPGAFVEFRGEGLAGSLYTETRNYRLEVRRQLANRARELSALPKGQVVDSYEERLRINQNREYSFASPNGDPWYEAPVLAQGSPAERSFVVSADAVAEASGRLKLSLWGVTNWPGETPDHHLEILWNGTRLTEDRFDGLVAREYDFTLPPGSVTDGDHQLTVRVLGDTGFSFDLVHVDRYTLVYPRRLQAQNDALSFAGVSGRLEVDGLTSNEVVAWAGNGRYRLSGLVIEPSTLGFKASFTLPAVAQSGAPVEISTLAALRVPSLSLTRRPAPDLLAGSASSLIVSHGSLMDGLAPLVAAQQSRGWTVKVVDVADIYAQYSGGEIDPEAIRQYVKVAVPTLGVRALTLVGGDTYDYLDYLGIGAVSLIPTPYAQSDDLIRFTPADSLYGDLDNDGVQELAVGRFPARTPAELESLIDKTLDFPSTPGRAVLAADGAEDQLFTTLSEGFATLLPPSWPTRRAYIDALGVPGAKGQLIAGVNQGAALVSFVGHSGPTVWSFSGLFSTGDVNALANAHQPSLVVQWGCWNTYHVSPRYDTMAHRLLLSGDRGAAAVVGSSTLSKTSSDQLLGPELMSRLTQPGKSLGEAMVEAKRAVAAGGGDLRDVLLGWTILGDPTLVLVP